MYKVKVTLVSGQIKEFESERDYGTNEDVLYWKFVYFPSTSKRMDTYSIPSRQILEIEEIEIDDK